MNFLFFVTMTVGLAFIELIVAIMYLQYRGSKPVPDGGVPTTITNKNNVEILLTSLLSIISVGIHVNDTDDDSVTVAGYKITPKNITFGDITCKIDKKQYKQLKDCIEYQLCSQMYDVLQKKIDSNKKVV